jgi:Raf kinase inhibitor-like YbhB/YbcL family protein
MVDPGLGGAARDSSPLRLTSPAFGDNQTIPVVYTCDGTGVSPPLSWSGTPRPTRQFALVLDDPDAPGGTFVHWTMWGLDPDVTQLTEGIAPPGAQQSTNSAGRAGYTPPCPPPGSPAHRYRFTLYALSRPLHLPSGASPSVVRHALQNNVIARVRLIGRYARTTAPTTAR